MKMPRLYFQAGSKYVQSFFINIEHKFNESYCFKDVANYHVNHHFCQQLKPKYLIILAMISLIRDQKLTLSVTLLFKGSPPKRSNWIMPNQPMLHGISSTHQIALANNLSPKVVSFISKEISIALEIFILKDFIQMWLGALRERLYIVINNAGKIFLVYVHWG